MAAERTAAPSCSCMQCSAAEIIYSLPSMIDTPQLCAGNHNGELVHEAQYTMARLREQWLNNPLNNCVAEMIVPFGSVCLFSSALRPHSIVDTANAHVTQCSDLAPFKLMPC